MKVCRNCLTNLSSDNFVRINKDSKYFHNYCNKCRSLIVSNRSIYLRAMKEPDKYKVCNNCDRMFSKYAGRPHVDGTKTEFSICKYCKSSDTESF